MTLLRSIAMLSMLVLSACGGGNDSQAPVPTQQFVDGIWEGRLGNQDAFAIIIANASGTTSDALIAKKVSSPLYPYGGTSPFDFLKGSISVRQDRLSATNMTYQNVQAFDVENGYTNGVTLSGRAIKGPLALNADQVSGIYSQPLFPVGVDGTVFYDDTALSLSRTSASNAIASLNNIRGTYKEVNGTAWSITLSGGVVVGSISGCAVIGGVAIRRPATSASSQALYEMNLSLGGTSPTCTRAGVRYDGYAFVKYDASSQRTGLRFIGESTNITTLRKASAGLVLDGTFISDITPVPLTTATAPEGFYVSTDGNVLTTYGVVLPDNQFYFYNVNGMVLFGRLQPDAASSVVASSDSTYHNAGNFVPNVYLMGDVRTDPVSTRLFTGNFNYSPLAASLSLTPFSLKADANLRYLLTPATAPVTATTPNNVDLTGTYKTGNGFNSALIDTVTLAKSGNNYSLTATTSYSGVDADGNVTCTLSTTVTPYNLPTGVANTTRNLYSVDALKIINCAEPALSGLAPQTGVLFAEFDGNTNTPRGIRLLTFGALQGSTTGQNVFFGTKQ